VSSGSTRAELSSGGVLATSAFGDGLIRLWDIATGEKLVEFRTD
jgi:hypothetical protein